MKPAPEPRRPPEECSRCHHVRPAVVISHFKPICGSCWNEMNNPQQPVSFSEVAAHGSSGVRAWTRTHNE